MIEIPEYYITLIILISIYSIASSGLNITSGYGGQVNLGQAAFLGIGAFSTAILAKQGYPFLVVIPISGILSMFVGVIIGIVSIRLRKDFLAITTIAFNFIMVAIFLYYPLFGESFGIIDIPRPTIANFTVKGFWFAIMCLVILALLLIFKYWILKSWIGKAFSAISQDETASYALGIDVRKFKVITFALGTFYGGIAGSLLAYFKTYTVYSDFSFVLSIEILTMMVLGGMGTIIGPLIGTTIYILIPELVRPLYTYRLAFSMFLLVILLRFFPSGLFGSKSTLRKFIAGLT